MVDGGFNPRKRCNQHPQRRGATHESFRGGLPTITHQLSLRDTIDCWRCCPGLERPGCHEVPLRGNAQTPLILLFMGLPIATTHQDAPPRIDRR